MIVKLMGFEAFTLAVFSTLHLTGVLTVGSASPSYGAGFAEALICVALVAGAWALARRANRERGRRTALFAVGFAILGFIVGLTFTIDGGSPIDLVYHLAMLPVLVATAVLLAPGRAARPPRRRALGPT
jgi:peptidoglycan/LPS O-acetylase OafA/YrhL